MMKNSGYAHLVRQKGLTAYNIYITISSIFSYIIFLSVLSLVLDIKLAINVSFLLKMVLSSILPRCQGGGYKVYIYSSKLVIHQINISHAGNQNRLCIDFNYIIGQTQRCHFHCIYVIRSNIFHVPRIFDNISLRNWPFSNYNTNA
ncbi:hypothetical protein J3Q64DRAFT_1702931 [Phycomyces blakesleeanus]|uniref:Uncharacterized protein n=2 Tax=Phycomyces blakesleeanus TaxID=4837 RepID=A0A162WAF1_PHYB8|nr:hypothetical protein PHYBLDRAFT_175808 [Phycomyces blakesleeanus NRRL 1555(-)]OAD65845.1 hypothetical protein PHYBLDRAFT_175808 [Phycomyces blakesleeanus NRRL 1555(-)]|eukprot:XP_018283885.1 hypothetical protein PHYBLDRAFT_175808 [Phycomyces blakesleeanus NRRL 1555(-)]